MKEERPLKQAYKDYLDEQLVLLPIGEPPDELVQHDTE
jgi:hypothetical protein